VDGLKVLTRVAAIAVASAVFVGLTWIYAGSIREPALHPQRAFRERHRDADARLGAFPKFVGQVGLVGLIALAGRKVLRIRLTD
jgi:hypothetical protein